ncbi:MAG: hypothetical protein ABSH01_29710 [Terriglobia bacterium]|jgi:hypothetical protein
MKTKDGCGKLWGKAGMFMKKKEIRVESGNVGENKGGRWYVVDGRWKMKKGGNW